MGSIGGSHVKSGSEAARTGSGITGFAMATAIVLLLSSYICSSILCAFSCASLAACFSCCCRCCRCQSLGSPFFFFFFFWPDLKVTLALLLRLGRVEDLEDVLVAEGAVARARGRLELQKALGADDLVAALRRVEVGIGLQGRGCARQAGVRTDNGKREEGRGKREEGGNERACKSDTRRDRRSGQRPQSRP